MVIRAVLLDFYGTLGESTHHGLRLADVLGEMGYDAPSDAIDRWFNDGLDGTEHDEHSVSRDHYVAWQRARFAALLDECGVSPADREAVSARWGGAGGAAMAAYDDAAHVLDEMRAAGLALAICSNWDWDLREAVAQAALAEHVDVMVSSAWVGARKPHSRIYTATVQALEEHTGMRYTAEEILFVGDTWSCDVSGPRAEGMRAAYVRREHREPDHTAPANVTEHVDGEWVIRSTDLHGLLGHVG